MMHLSSFERRIVGFFDADRSGVRLTEGEKMQKFEFAVHALQAVVTGGKSDTGPAMISIDGMEFAHAAWRRPCNSNQGIVLIGRKQAAAEERGLFRTGHASKQLGFERTVAARHRRFFLTVGPCGFSRRTFISSP
jgi:hypothetical protein